MLHVLARQPVAPDVDPAAETVAVLGLGYVGLPTSLALAEAGFGLVGIDVSARRMQDIKANRAELTEEDRRRLTGALANPRVTLTMEPGALAAADAVLICVPTPINGNHEPDLAALHAACAQVVEHAREGQVLILTSTTHVGATRELLAEPLATRGLIAGTNIFVAFSPERIDPGCTGHPQHMVPRVVGGVTAACADAALPFLREVAASVVVVSGAEAAELEKLYENTFRAVNIALANELADIACAHGLDAIEIVDAAATKPYGFMPFYPGAGAGGHCIPCDPHYMLEPLDRLGVQAPLVSRAMQALHARPRRVLRRAIEVLAADGVCLGDARVLVVGVAYKPGIGDLRESPGLEIFNALRALGATVDYHDPFVPGIEAEDGTSLVPVDQPDPTAYDIAVVTVLHPTADLSWMQRCPRVLDCTYRLSLNGSRHVV
jgi:UDP-N-acetyl-D-glucosamine dehydrogenase